MPLFQTIDLSQPLNQIKQRYGERYFFKPEAFTEAADLWGFTDYNQHGVIPSQEESILEANSCKASLRLAESTKGYWLMSYSIETSLSGASSCPNVFDSIGYSTREDAVEAGTFAIKDFYQQELDAGNNSHKSSHRIGIEQAIKLIEQSEKQPELDLFALSQTSGGNHAR